MNKLDIVCTNNDNISKKEAVFLYSASSVSILRLRIRIWFDNERENKMKNNQGQQKSQMGEVGMKPSFSKAKHCAMSSLDDI